MESTLQKAVKGLDHTPGGDPGYRAVVVSAGPIFENPELGPLVEMPETTVWSSPKGLLHRNYGP